MLSFSVRPELVPNEVIGLRPSTFLYGHQQDSFEYLGYLLDQLHEEERRFLKGDIDLSNGSSQLNQTIRESEEMDWDDEDSAAAESEKPASAVETNSVSPAQSQSPQREIQKTLIERVFAGRATVTYKCLECTSTSSIVDNFFDLQLAFPPADGSTPSKIYSNANNEYSTQSLLNDYFLTEQLIDEDRYYCEKCARRCDGERHIQVEDAPSNLILLVKHFKYDRKVNVRRKILNRVRLNETITLQTHQSDGESLLLTYRLYAAVVHSGMSIDSGHYYTFGTDSSGNWFNFNDSFISGSSLDDIHSLNDWNTPYILFYKQIGSEKCAPIGNSLSSTCKNSVDLTNGSLQEHELSPLLRDYVRKHNVAYRQNPAISPSGYRW